MMKKIISLLFVLLLTVEVEASLINDKKGFWITPKATPQNGLILKNGEDFTFEGDVCVVKWGTFGNEKCLKIQSSQVVFKAYYPDSLHDITEQLVVTQAHDKKTWKYKFKTGLLKDIDLNQFTLTVGSSSKKADDLMKVKAKFEKRVLILKEFRNQYAGKQHYHKNIMYLTNLINYLELLISRIDLMMESNPEILAQIRQPIQVENKISGPLLYSSNFSGFKLTLKIPTGVMFEGEKTTIESSVTNLSDKSFYFPGFENDDEDDDDDHTPTPTGNQAYRLSIELDGSKLIQTQAFSLGFGQTKTTSVQTNKLNSHSFNKIKTHLEKSSSGNFDFYSFFNRRLGSLSYDLSVIEDTIAPQFSNIKPLADSYHKTLPTIEATIKDLLGRIDSQSLEVKLKGFTAGNVAVDQIITNRFTITEQGSDSFLLAGNSGTFTEGTYEIIFTGKDTANNLVTTKTLNIIYDGTAPVINLVNGDGRLTNQSLFNISANVLDHNPVETRITHNGNVVFNTNEMVIDYNAQLVEGLNVFEIEAVDAAGNVSIKKGLYNIIYDSTPPVLSDFTPTNNENIYSLTFNSQGNSNEALLEVKVNGKLATLSADKKSFSVVLNGVVEGNYPIQVVATDKALNSTTENFNVKIILKVLNIDLISVAPHPSNAGKLIISGGAGATRPGAEIRLYAGFFNQKTFLSNTNNGSFEATLDYFDSVEVRSKDLELDRTETGTLTYNIDTTLAGVIKDTEDRPLPGVKVAISSSGQYAITDSTGSFAIPKPATGDQVLSLDGTTIPLSVSGPNKKYSRVNIAVSIGTRQSNVLDKPLYLAPLMFDGSETNIADENSSVIVESPHAPGVSLAVPAGVATFPNGTKAGVISVAEINANFSAVPVLEFAKPQTVYAFEPSGLKFSEPVELTLPNVNEIPAGVQMVIMSKNSEKGIWEIDGLARVSEDGSEIVTEEGGGITHFSEVYAVPLGPKVTEYGGTSHPGADTSNGILKNSIELPSYKVLGKDVSFGLNYQSNWANPSVVISNVIDVPRNEYNFSSSVGGRSLVAKVNVDLSGKTWIEPEEIRAKFYTNNYNSSVMKFKGVPQKSVVSFAMNLDSLVTGIHTYNSHYDIQLKELILGTVTTKTKKTFGATRTSQESFSETRILEELFPQDLGGALYVQNYLDSKVGQGWRINGVGKIYNVDGPRILVEESNGETTSYAINSNIETFFYNSNKNLTAVDFSSWPLINMFSDNDRIVSEYDTISNSTTSAGIISDYSGKLEGYAVGSSRTYDSRSRSGTCTYFCSIEYVNYSRSKSIKSIFGLDANQKLVMTTDGLIESYNNNIKTNFSGKLFSPTSDLVWIYGGDPWPYWYCSSVLGASCSGSARSGYSTDTANYFGAQGVCPIPEQNNPAAIANACKSKGGVASSSGEIGEPGFQDGSNPSYNSISNAIKGFGDEIILADFGNNRVRAFNIVTGVARTIAGNGQTYDNGDNQVATLASIFHPRGLAKDSQGNIYVSTENGFIRKIEPNGYISTFAGKVNGILSDKSQAQDMRLNNPYGMVVDSVSNYLYVADTGHHRVVRINLITREAVTVAGSGSCQSGNIGDGKAAINSSLCNPTSLGLDDQKNLLIFDQGHNRIRRVNFENTTNGNVEYQSLALDHSSLIKHADGTFTRNFRNGAFYSYDAEGKQVESSDLIGNKYSYEYNSDSQLVKVIDPTYRNTIFSYSWGLLDSIEDPQGRITRFNFTGEKLTSVHYPDGSEKSYSYSPNGLMTSEVNKRGAVTSYFYNNWSRLLKIVRPDNSQLSFSEGIADTVGNSYTSNQSGILKSLLNDGLPDKLQINQNDITTVNKDENGFVTKMTDSAGRVTLIDKDLEGRPLKITRFDGSVVNYEYDSRFLDLIKKTDLKFNTEIEYLYDDRGNLISQSLLNGETITYVYDQNTGLLVSKTLPLNNAETYTYFTNGLLKNKTNTLNQSTSYVYGAFGNLVSVKDALNNEIILARDSSGNIISHTSQNNLTTSYLFDVHNRLVKVTSPKNEITNYEYLISGELSKIIDPKLNEIAYEYDVMGRQIKTVDVYGKIHETSYDINNNVTSEIDRKGQIKTYEYDSKDRLIKMILPDDIYEYSYDENEKLKSIKNKDSFIQFSYEDYSVGQLISKETVSGSLNLSSYPVSEMNYDYDIQGNLTNLTSSVGEFKYSYDKLNRLVALKNHKNEVFDFQYDYNSKLVRTRTPANIVNLGYDGNNSLTDLQYLKRSNSSVISDSILSRDFTGNVLKIENSRGESNFSYDNNSNLISSSGGESLSRLFNYDPLGNRISDNNGNYVYDSKASRLVEDYRYSYLYDDNGNLITKISKANPQLLTKFEYNSQNQLKFLTEFNGSSEFKKISYYYDALDRRAMKKIENSTDQDPIIKKYIYDGQDIIAELDSDNSVVSVFTHSKVSDDDVLSIDQNGHSYFYVKDHIGSIVEIINSSGNIVQSYVYSSFGKIEKYLDQSGQEISEPIVNNSFTFTGREFDSESGLYYYRSRYYDSSIGRFITNDPDEGDLSNPTTFINKYSYVYNNPLKYRDPTGANPFKKLLGVATLISQPFFGLATMNLTDFFTKNFDYTERDERRSNQTAITTGAAALAAYATIVGADPNSTYSFMSIYLTTAVSAVSAEVRTGNFLDNFNRIATVGYLGVAFYAGIVDPGLRSGMGVNPFEFEMVKGVTPTKIYAGYSALVGVTSSFSQRKRPEQYKYTYSSQPR